jgi:hypothetical protein
MFLEIRDENFLSKPPSNKSVTSANLNRVSASGGRVQGYTSGNIFYFPRGGRDMARRNIFWRNLVSLQVWGVGNRFSLNDYGSAHLCCGQKSYPMPEDSGVFFFFFFAWAWVLMGVLAACFVKVEFK